MLRVGLTGGLGSGKSTVAAMLRALGAEVIEADALGRALMEPGQPVYAGIVRAFGPGVVDPDGRLNRARLAALAFQDEPGNNRLGELNAIIHPAVIAAQRQWMEDLFRRNPAAVAVVESALIFEVERDARARGENETALAGAPSDRDPQEAIFASRGGSDKSSSPGLLTDWRRRIDRVVVVTAPDELKIVRYAARVCPTGVGHEAVEADARLRLAHQIPDAVKAARADYILENTGDKAALRAQVQKLWQRLQAENYNFPQESL